MAGCTQEIPQQSPKPPAAGPTPASTPTPSRREAWLDKDQLAEHYSCGKRSIETALADDMPHAVVFGRIKFRVSETDPWLREHGYLRDRGDAATPSSERWLDKDQLAEHYSCGKRSIETALAEEMPHAVVFGRIKFRVSATDPWLLDHGYIRPGGILVPNNTNGAGTAWGGPAPDHRR